MPAPSSPQSPDASPRLRLLAALALAAAAALAWANSFSGPFVFDDRPAILANPSLENFATALSPPRDGGTVAGRPLVNLSFALNRAIGGTDVWSYHVFNLLIHLAAGLTLFALIRRTLIVVDGDLRAPSDRKIEATAHASAHISSTPTVLAFAAALLWLLHPLQTAAVTYVVQRAESLMALCFLLTMYGFARSAQCHLLNDTSPRAVHAARAWACATVTSCLAGMLCKEVMAVAPLVVLLYDRTFIAGGFSTALRTRWRLHAALAATWLPLAWLVATNAARAGTAGFASAIAPLDYALTQCAAVVHYLRLAFWPDALVFDYGTAVETAFARVWPHALLLAGLVAATLVALRRAPAWGFLGAAFFLILAPSSSIVPVATQTIAEHRMYLPLAALSAGIVLLLYATLRNRVLFVALPLALALGLVTHQRNRDYRDALALWSDTVAKRPANARAHNNLGIELARAGRPAEAAPHFEIALAALPGDAELHNNFGNVLLALGRPADALRHFEQSVRLKPETAAARLNLAHALLQAGRPADAIAHFEAAEKSAPLDANALTGLGTALLQTERLPDAIARYRQAVQLDPQLARAHYNLGLALARTNQFADAAGSLRESVRLDPANVAARVNLGNVLLLTRRTAEAIAEYEAALRLQPDNAQVRANLARAQTMLRRSGP